MPKFYERRIVDDSHYAPYQMVTLPLTLSDPTHTHTQPFYSPFSWTTRVNRCQKRTSGLYGARED